MPSMPGQSAINQHEEFILTSAGAGIAYATLIIGYLYTILSTTHLTPLNFLVFSALQVGYVAMLWWMWKARKGWQLALGMALLAVVTEVVSLLPLIGLQWDWLMFLVTVALSFSFLPLWVAIGAGIFLYVVAIVDLGWLSNWNWPSAYPSMLSLLPAFAFVALFSLVVQILQNQKDRAEHLLSQLGASNAELEQAHRRLQAYADEVEELAIVRERTRLAREIHDTLGHYLSILTIQLETIAKLQERDPARAAVEIAEARRVAAQSMQEVRNAVAALRPTSIATLGLGEALVQLGQEFEQGAPDTALTLDLETELPALSPDIAVALYRAAQEALTNIRKHAQASKALVRLRCEHGTIELLVQDNGRGTATNDDAQKGGFGLVGLRERLELLGGQVRHGPAEQGGYRQEVQVPVPPASPSQVANQLRDGLSVSI
jgi:signal transduction histidine kinase